LDRKSPQRGSYFDASNGRGVGKAGVTLAKAGKHGDRRRASFSFDISEPAEVAATVTRAAPGVRNGDRCVAIPEHPPRGAKSCKRQLPAAKATVALTAVDATGNASTPVVVRFTVR
jgi:hypothetical protein